MRADSLGKKATCTVDVDGFVCAGNSVQFIRGGKPYTGWMDQTGAICFIDGPEAYEDLTGRRIAYFDPATKLQVEEGLHRINGKAYLFKNGLLVTSVAEGDPYIINPDGSVFTGWKETGDNLRYYDPATGLPVRNDWVPAPGGKGETWVNDEGYNRSGKGDNGGQALMDATGIIEVQEWYGSGCTTYTYYFNAGVIQTGWLYFTESGGNYTPSTAKKATVILYAEPRVHGALQSEGLINGKLFIPNAGDSHFIYLPKYYNSAAKYAYFGSTITAADGSLVRNSLVDVYVSKTEHYKMYADNQGRPVMGSSVTIKGVTYFFDENGRLTNEATDTGLYVLDGGKPYRVFTQLANAKKPKKGVNYYYETPETPEAAATLTKFASAILYELIQEEGANEYYPVQIVDKNSRLAVNGPVNARPDLASPAATYLVNKYGDMQLPSESPLAFVNGKLYSLDPETWTVQKNGLVQLGSGYYGFADKNGVLARNAFKNVPGIGTMYFDYQGRDYKNPGSSYIMPLVIKGKAYAMNPVDYEEDELYAVYKPKKAGWVEKLGSYDLGCYVNKNGTCKTGFVTGPGGARYYYATVQNPRDGTSLLYRVGSDGNMLYKIGGKLYLFGGDERMITGWVYIRNARIIDIKHIADYASATESVTGALMYFNPKTGAATTGGWKKVPVPLAVNGELSFGEEDIGIGGGKPVNVTGQTAKLYFTANGELLRDTTMVIKKKLYKFASDGTSALTAGWLNSRKTQYALKNGTLATGRVKIDGQYYLFDSEGWKVTNALRKSGGKWYYYDYYSGAQAMPAIGNYPFINGISNRSLEAVWNKDGSLAKIVYANSGLPAGGETVRFGDNGTGNYNTFLLDSKGLPATGAVSIGEYRVLLNADGSRFVDESGKLSLVLFGGKYYLIEGDALYSTGESQPTAVQVENWSALSAADQKTMAFYEGMIIVNPDGSAAANQIVEASIDGTAKAWHTNRMGVPLDFFTPVYRFKGKWYVDPAIAGTAYGINIKKVTMEMMMSIESQADIMGIMETVQIRTKANGELKGFYGSNGKPLTGMFELMSPGNSGGGVISLKKGKPVTGSLTFTIPGLGSESFYLDPDCGMGGEL